MNDVPVDEVSKPWWDATVEKRFVIQRCRACGHWQHYPRALCTGCGSTDLRFDEVSGSGVVDTYTQVMRAVRADSPPPYVVARVRLAEGPVLLTRLIDLDATEDLIDRAVRLAWLPLPDGRNLPVFRLHEER
ncbi:MAG TPA: zinc ribbon domain-containing protein [Streptosporangiaceae bacterium]|nr:zinc ribbon domain-containing protein [Streptosporangiaceae bacterium]